MFLQFLKTGCRIFLRERIYTVLNVLGLSVGITVALIIFLYLQNDLTYDWYYQNGKNIYRVNSVYTSAGNETKYALSPISFGPRISEEFPEIVAYTRFGKNGGMLSYDDKKFSEDNLFYADTGFFKVFTHKFIYGEPATCLRETFSIVLTQKLAKKYFSDINPVGKVLTFNNQQTFTVTGVIEDLPENVHSRYDAVIQLYDPQGISKNASFFDISVYTYLLLPEDYDINQFYSKLPSFHEKYIAEGERILNQKYKPVLQPLRNVHFSNEWTYDLPNGNKAYLIAFLIIGILVLSLSCINYLNLTTARAERRRKEISIKKILGSRKSELISQFLTESILMSAVSMIVALGLAKFILEFTSFNTLIDKNLQILSGKNPVFFAGILVLTLLIGLASGLYPAFYLSGVKPLKSASGGGNHTVIVRKLLVVTQIVISVGVIICTLLVGRQMDFVSTKDLGLNKENLLILPLRDTAVTNHLRTLKEKLGLNPAILSVTTASNLPAGWLYDNLYKAETDQGMQENEFFTMVVGYDYLETMGVKLLNGRNFDKSFTTDPRSAFLINETLAKNLKWSDPIGKRLQQGFGPDGQAFYDGVVIGVVKDFNYASLHNAIEPLVIRVQQNEGGQLLVKLDGNDIPGAMRFVEKAWNDLASGFPEDYSFLDRNFDQLYKHDRQQNMLVKIFSWICILISFLGLLSLSSYITKNRTREIAIRKVHGASVGNVVLMLYREILILVLVASLITSPLSYYLTSRLIDSFAYKARFSPGIFLLAIAGAVITALITVSYHSIMASVANPAGSLKYE